MAITSPGTPEPTSTPTVPAATTPGLHNTLSAGVEMVRLIVQPLAEALGPGVEVVLHDLTQVPDSIVAIGGHISGRSVGGPSTDLLLQHVREQRTDHLLRYPNRTTDGRELISSTLFLRDESSRAVACLCFNSDVSEWARIRDAVTAMLPAVSDTSESAPPATERFFETTDDLVASMIQSALSLTDVPIELMQKRHKLLIVEELESRGFFSFREAAELLAKTLQVSRYTIYNYLNETRAHAQDTDRPPTDPPHEEQ